MPPCLGIKAQQIKEAQELGPEDQYIRRIQELGGSNSGLLVLCMFPFQSRQLQLAETIQADTMFKRVSLMEFELAGEARQRGEHDLFLQLDCGY